MSDMIEIKLSDINTFIKGIKDDLSVKAIKATSALSESNDFVKLIADLSINYIVNNQAYYEQLSNLYSKRKGNFDIFFGTKEELMVKDIASGNAFIVAFDSSIQSVVVSIANEIAVYHQSGNKNLPQRSILEIDNKAEQDILEIATLVIAEFLTKEE